MKRSKIAILVVFALLVILQFFRPERNTSGQPSRHAMSLQFPLTARVQSILQRSCHDCHSNNTVYPWYAAVQPVGWWLNKHIGDGKRGVNFDEYSLYRPMRQYRKFKEIIDQVESDAMPLKSYLVIHTRAKLNKEEKQELVEWCTAMRDSMKTRFPVDSLERRAR